MLSLINEPKALFFLMMKWAEFF